MPYANLDNLIADYLPEAKSAKEINAVTRILDSASAFVDSYCRQRSGYFSPLEADSPPTLRRVRGEGNRFLRLPVHIFGSISKVELYGNLIDSAAYYESDKNGWLYLEDDYIRTDVSFSSGWLSNFAPDATYQVTARWGLATTPLPIVEAVRLIVARIYSVQKGTIGQITAEGFIQERLIPAAAKDLLKGFIKREFEI